jgi:predicted site-specific integrase-resolvase
MGPVSLVVMEKGSRWPWRCLQSANVVAVADEALADSGPSPLASIERRCGRVKTAILACNASVGKAARARRAKLGAALLRAVGAEDGRVVLHADAEEARSRQLQSDLFALADTLSARLHGTSTTIQVHFASAGV